MANLTIKVEDELLKRARIRAIEQGTSVNAVLAEHLARFAGDEDPQEQAVQLMFVHAEASGDDLRRAAARGSRSWTRDSLHDR